MAMEPAAQEVPNALSDAPAALSGALTPPDSRPAGPAQPVELSDRILDLDILRGVALLGILAANMRGFSAPMDIYFAIHKWYQSTPDILAQFFIDVFVQRKFVTLFSFMFGLGFALQMDRAETKGSRFMSFYPRRLLALGAFGIIHGIVIWAGDVLLTYAIAGGLLLLFRHRPQKRILRTIVIFFSAIAAILSGIALVRAFGWYQPKPDKPLDMNEVARAIHVYAYGSLSDILRQNWVEWLHELRSQMFAIFAVSIFLMGLYVYRSGLLRRLGSAKAKLGRIAMICVPSGVLVSLATTILVLRFPDSPRPVFVAWFVNLFTILGPLVQSAGYAATLMVLLQNARVRKWLTPFAAVGRTALTNYLAQSLICVTFFRLTHLTGVWGPAMDLIPTVVLFAAQIVVSNWWLQRFRFGPMEWLWRSLTYGTLPKMRLEVLKRAAANV